MAPGVAITVTVARMQSIILIAIKHIETEVNYK
jgi:hypothetical protein